MKTDPNNTNPIRALSHPEQASSADINPAQKVYEVTLHRTDYFVMTLRIKAATELEAERLAERRGRMVSEWYPMESDCSAVEVKTVKEGK